MRHILVELTTDIVSEPSKLDEALLQLASIGFVRDAE